MIRWFSIFLFFNLSQILSADLFHYNNVLIGDRAIGLGGAYSGVSDDASGVFYNPAGLGFALTNDISGSANAFYKRKIVYKSIINKRDFTENSSGSLPSFFGGLNKLDNLVKGLVFAFGVYSTDNDQKDQNDLFENEMGSPANICNQLDENNNIVKTGTTQPSGVLQRFHRTVTQTAATGFYGAAIGLRVRNNISLGFGLNAINVSELIQEYQDVRTLIQVCNTQTGEFNEQTDQSSQNIRQTLTALGVQPVFGFQMTLMDSLSFGLSYKFSSLLSQEFTQYSERRTTRLGPTSQETVDSNPAGFSAVNGAVIRQLTLTSKATNPLANMPSELRIGGAYFASARLLITFDATHYSEVKDADKITYVGRPYDREAVTNFSGGIEYYLLPAIPFRFGFFTNNDARPELDANKEGQKDHVDYIGGTIFLGWVQPNSQVGVGLIYQQGSGHAQKVGGTKTLQIVEGSSQTLAISATHSF